MNDQVFDRCWRAHTIMHEAPRSGPVARCFSTLLALLLWTCLQIGLPESLGAQIVPTSEAVDDTVCVNRGALEPGRLTSSEADFGRLAEVAGVAEGHARLILRGGALPSVQLCPSRIPASWRSRVREASGSRWSLLPIREKVIYRTGYPTDRNDGALWQGRGLSSEISGGIAFQEGPLSVAISPEVALQENRSFDIVPVDRAGRSELGFAWYGTIDLPQRFGTESFWTLSPGQSHARLALHRVAGGISTENIWWGPGIRNSILMSNTAAGFPHAFLETDSPLDIWVGDLEVQVVWASLDESSYFDDDASNDSRPFTGLVVDLEPRWLPGLYLGVARAFLYPGDGDPSFGERYFPFFQSFLKEDLTSEENPGGNSPDDQLLSFYGRWVLPESGFEVYGEWARSDHSWDFEDLFQEPEHSQAYTLGFQKVVRGSERWVRLGGELTHLQERPVARVGRSTPVYYRHSTIIQGYTHRGQLLGAWIGPGADSQWLGVDVFGGGSSYGLSLERVRRNENVYYSVMEGTQFEHDAEAIIELHQLLRVGSIDLGWVLSYGFRWNRDFGADDVNWAGGLSATWQP